ncbi:unnamed protein product [Caenorhabditis bovis]|uniref:Uncharacterized protein n=1 Tax=Caenorhabditis bovis TaxID=2654633 RepID=A0A8S1EXI2_9PELO|nr:unnamed protein product [Caenorhabditis bovis]
MIDIDSLSLPVLIAALIGVITIMGTAIIYLTRKQNETDEDVDAVMDEIVQTVSTEPPKKNKHQRKNDQWKAKVNEIKHLWFVTTLKGHTSNVVDIDFATGGKKFVSISDDRTAFLWDVRDFENKEHKCSRQVIEYDTPTHVSFAPDCKSVVFSMRRENKICVYRLVKKEGTSSHHFSHVENLDFEKRHQPDITDIGIASNAKYLMTASTDNKIYLYDLRGSVLKCIDAKANSLHDCRLSPDGRFVIVSGFTPDVFVYEPIFSRDGNFQDAKKVFNMSGHSSGVLAAAFNSASTRAVTVSRDGFWRIFDIDIRYNAGQDATILRKGRIEELAGLSSENMRLAMSPSGNSFSISIGSNLMIFSSEDENKKFPELCELHDERISAIRYSSDGKLIATCGDKYIRVVRNVPEYHSIVTKLTRELPECTQETARRRIKEQIEEAKKELAKFE